MAATPDEGWQVAFRCPGCQQMTYLLLAVPIYVLQVGPSLCCEVCGAMIRVHLEVVLPGIPTPTEEDQSRA